jgi:hypothetical protein
MKKFIFISLFFSISEIAYSSDEILKICLTGSIEKALPNYGEAFLNGAKLALSELSDVEKKRVEIVYNPHDTTPLAAIKKLNELRGQNCDAIVGFSTGNDLISIEENLKNSPIFTLSIYGDPQPRFGNTNYLRTMQPSSKELTKHLLSRIKIKQKSKILMITAIDRSEMTSYREAFLFHLKDKNVQLTQIEVLEQAKDLSSLRKLVKNDRTWDYAILLTRSTIAAESSDIIHQYTKPTLLGTKYMGSPELPAFYNFLKNKKIKMYFSRQNCTCSKNTEYENVVKRYLTLFGIQPMGISVDTYDAIKFIFQAKYLNKINPHTVIQFLNSSKANYKGPSSLSVSSGLNLKVTDRFLMMINERGYEEVK